MAIEELGKPAEERWWRPPQVLEIEERQPYIKLLVYGEAGTGKTYLACSAKNSLLLLTEPAVSDATIRAVRRNLGHAPDIWQINSIQDMNEAYAYLVSDKNKYDLVAIDSLTDLYRRIMAATLKSVEAAKERRKAETDVPEQSDWYRVQERQRDVIRKLRDLPMHVVMTALTMDIRSEGLTVPYVQPKGFAQELPAFFNYVGILTTEQVNDKVIRKLTVQKSAWCLTKNAGDVLSPEMVDPTLEFILEQFKR